MKELMAQLRAKLDDKKALVKKRSELRTRLEGLRDTESAEYTDLRDEYYGFDDQMETLNDEISELRSQMAEKTIEDKLRAKPDPATATVDQKREMLESGEYRDAFFRSVASRRVAEADAEIMAFGKREITDFNGDSIHSGASYLIPTTTYNMIVSVIKEYGQVYSAVSKTGFNGDISIPIGTLRSKTENADGTFSLDFDFTEVKISQEAIVGTIIVKNILLKNSISALEGYLVKELGMQIALKLDNAVINGDSGSFKGVKEDLIPKSYTTLDWDQIVTIEHTLKKAYSKTAGWIMNWTTFGKFRKLKGLDNLPLTSVGQIVVNDSFTANFAIDNKPVLIVDSTIIGDNDILFGNLNAYHVNESQSIIIESDASPEFKTDKTVWRGKVYSGGQPVLPTENFALFVLNTDAVAKPTANPAAGEVASGTSITLATTTTGATIYYTLDGSTPTRSSAKYSASNKPSITAAGTLKAIAVKNGMADSEVLSAAYTLSA